MKRFDYIFRSFLAVILINLTTNVQAQESALPNTAKISEQNARINENAEAWLDSVDFSLLTCGPGDEVWSYYGHTALRIEDKVHHSDIVVNWGLFSFRQGNFILRFVFGHTDYQMGIMPTLDFIAEYSSQRRWVRQQRLRLTRDEKLAISRAIEANYRIENRTYRYNFFYDNCTTRARNIVFDNIDKQDVAYPSLAVPTTYRNEIHQWNKTHRWARFGNDLLLGYEADKNIGVKAYEFLPDNLSKNLDITSRNIEKKDGTIEEKRPIVDSVCYLIPPQAQMEASEAITPSMLFACLAVIIAILCGAELYKKKNFWWLDAALLVLTGLPGLILLAMVFSLHPTVQVNFQILILNPLNLIFLWKTIKKQRIGKTYWYYNVWGGLLALSVLMQIWQHYAEGMEVLALSLLLRYCVTSIRHELKIRK